MYACCEKGICFDCSCVVLLGFGRLCVLQLVWMPYGLRAGEGAGVLMLYVMLLQGFAWIEDTRQYG